MNEKVVIVTGGTSGIGAYICKLFKENQAKVIAVARKSPNECYGEFMSCDISDENSVKKLIKTIKDRYGKIDVLINNAGITGENLPCDELKTSEFEKVFKLNVMGTFLMSKYSLKVMKEQNFGVIINISSTLGMVGSQNFGAYAPSKAAVIGITKQNAINYAKYGIRVNAISPGTVMTQTVSNIKDSMGNEAFGRIFDAPHPLGGVGSPEDVANAAFFLASDKAKWITGANLVVDGGYTAQ